MKPQLERIENYPEVGAKLEQHIRETEGQIARIEEILDSLGEDHSTLKGMALSFTARWRPSATQWRATRS